MIRPENDEHEQRIGRDRGARGRSVVPRVDGTKVIIEFDARENPSRADQRCKRCNDAHISVFTSPFSARNRSRHDP